MRGCTAVAAITRSCSSTGVCQGKTIVAAPSSSMTRSKANSPIDFPAAAARSAVRSPTWRPERL